MTSAQNGRFSHFCPYFQAALPKRKINHENTTARESGINARKHNLKSKGCKHLCDELSETFSPDIKYRLLIGWAKPIVHSPNASHLRTTSNITEIQTPLWLKTSAHPSNYPDTYILT